MTPYQIRTVMDARTRREHDRAERQARQALFLASLREWRPVASQAVLGGAVAAGGLVGIVAVLILGLLLR